MNLLNDGEEGFSFIWTIQNYDMCFRDDDGDIPHISPGFELDENSNENWCFAFCPKRYPSNDDIRIFLERRHCIKRRGISIEISICNINGSFTKLITEELLYKKQTAKTKFNLILNKRVCETYPNIVNLTIKFRMWLLDTEVLMTRQCYARTIFDANRIVYPCKLKCSGCFECYINYVDGERIIFSEFPMFSMQLSLTESESHSEKAILTTIKLIKPDSTLYCTCEISLIDVYGRKAHSVQHKGHFSEAEPKWCFPFMQLKELPGKDNLYFPNDILQLRCEFAVSSGVIYNRMERTEYGTEFPPLRRDSSELPPLCKCSDQASALDWAVSLKDNMQRFYAEGKFSDFTIKTPSKEFPVHKSILCARSEVFSTMLEHDMKESRTGIVEINDMDDDTISKMLLFMYTDTMGEDPETASSLYPAADKYGIVPLKKKCRAILKDNITLTNVLDILVLADMYGEDNLKCLAQDFIHTHSDTLVDSEEWVKFVDEHAPLAAKIMHTMLKRVKRSYTMDKLKHRLY